MPRVPLRNIKQLSCAGCTCQELGAHFLVAIGTALILIKEFMKVHELVEFEHRLSAVEITLRDAAV